MSLLDNTIDYIKMNNRKGLGEREIASLKSFLKSENFRYYSDQTKRGIFSRFVLLETRVKL